MNDLVTQNEYPISSPEELQILVQRNKEEGYPDLDFKKKAFAYEYILGYNHRDSAAKVGFSKDTGIKLLRDPLLSAFIADLQEMQLTSNLITKDFINAQYIHLLDCSMGRVEIPMVTAMGDELDVKKMDIPSSVNILKEMSKSTEYAKDTGNKTAPVNINIDFGALMGADVPPPAIDVQIDE